MRVHKDAIPVQIDVPGAVARQSGDFGAQDGAPALAGEYLSLGAGLDITLNARLVLTEFAVNRQRVVLSPRHRAVLGLVIAERDRFPDLAQIYFERGPQRSGRQLVTYLEALRNREILAIDDAEEAAEFFIGMLFQRWLRQVLYMNLPPPSEASMRARAERVVARFWAAYRRGPH